MNRFKASKYKNSFSHVYKKENWINDLLVGSNLRSGGHHIAASCQYVAFIHDSNCIGSLAVLPLSSHGRYTQFPMVAGHSGFVTDFSFSSFDDRLLATSAEDGFVKLWQLPEELTKDTVISSACQTLPQCSERVESLVFHPTADRVLASASGHSAKIWDVEQASLLFECGGHDDCVQNLSWHGNGTLLATLSKAGRERVLRLYDPRAGTDIIAESKCHSGLKDASMVWLGDASKIVTAGFGVTREAELALWDVSNMVQPLTKQSLGSSSTGSPMLFFDDDTKMLFLALKSETTISFFESTDKSPYITQGGDVCRCPSQTKGLAMVPKRALDVMACQVARFMQLTQNAVVPIGYYVQRKSHTDFHSDLFPDTAGPTPALTAHEWASGNNAAVVRVSLDPAKRKKMSMTPAKKDTKPSSTVTSDPTKQKTSVKSDTASKEEKNSRVSPKEVVKSPSHKVVTFVRSSKFRHIEGSLSHKSSTIDKLPALSSTVPGDSNAFQANKERAAVVLSVAGGQIAVLELDKPGRLDTNSVPTLQNTADVMDFCFDPFNPNRLAVACDDAKIRLWDIPSKGLTHTLTQPDFCLVGHQEKANVLAFHPQAEGLLASAGYDGKLLLWDLASHCVVKEMEGLPHPLFALAWSRNGSRLATFSKDHRLRVFEPRCSCSAVVEGEGPVGSRGARILWLNENTLFVSGFNKTSVRTLSIYTIEGNKIVLKSEINTNISPATLVPYFDPDTNLVFLSGKGDTSIIAYEYVPKESPFLFEVSPFSCGSAHQAIAVLPKNTCDVKRVEILKGVRLTKNSIEHFAIRVPRTRLEFFQDDIYPNTLVHWESALSASQWLEGKDSSQRTLSLQPPGMKPLSEAPKAAVAPKKFPSYNPDIKSDEQKKEELLSAMIDRMGEKEEDPLPQAAMDGCESDEWSD